MGTMMTNQEMHSLDTSPASTGGGAISSPLLWGPYAAATLACIAEAQAALATADSSGFNQHQKYNYPKYEDVLKAVHPYTSKWHCALLFTILKSTTQVMPLVDGNGKSVFYAVTECTGRMYLVNSQNSLEDWVYADCYGFSMDKNSDKALKAHTICRKYALKGLFGVTDNQDPDDSAMDVRGQFNQMATFTPMMPGRAM